MSEIIRSLGGLINVAATYFFLLMLCEKIYICRKGIVKKLAVCVAAVVGMQIVHGFHNSYVNITYLLLSSQILCTFIYRAPLKKSLPKNICYCIATTFGDIITIVFVGMITESTPSEATSDIHIMLFISIIYVLIVFFIYRIYSTLLSSKELLSLRLKELIFIVFLTVFEFFVLYCFTRSNSPLNYDLLIITVSGFLILDIYAAYIVNAVADGYKNKYEIDAIRMQSEIQSAHYEELNNKYVETQCMIHDIEKHISAIEKLSKNRDFSEAEQYTAKLRAELKRHKNIFECSNKILSAVMS